jgi:hypothetical protein
MKKLKNRLMLICLLSLIGVTTVKAQITVWEASNSVTAKTFAVTDTKLAIKLTGPLNSNNKDFMGVTSPEEAYDVYFSNSAGTEVSKNTNCVTIRGQYYGNSPTGFNISRVDLMVGSVTNYYSTVTANNLGGGNASTINNAVDPHTNTTTQLGNSLNGNVMSLTLCEVRPIPPPPSVDVCCPPITKEILAKQLQYKGTSINAPYQLQFSPTTQYSNIMQNYAQVLYNFDNSITQLNMVWELIDVQTSTSLESHWVGWTAPSTSPIGNINFFTTQLQVGKQYKIHTWMNMGAYETEKWFGKGCNDGDIFVKIEVLQSAQRGEPTLVVSDSKGKIIDRIPVRPIKR